MAFMNRFKMEFFRDRMLCDHRQFSLSLGLSFIDYEIKLLDKMSPKGLAGLIDCGFGT